MATAGTRRFLFKVIGKRISVLFGAVCFLSVAVLAAIYLTSTYALQAYVSDQTKRLPWDIIANQSAPIQSYPSLQREYRTHEGIQRVEMFGMLRGLRGALGIELQADGQSLPVRWFVFVASSNPEVILPDLRLPEGASDGVAEGQLPEVRATLVGSSGRAYDIKPGSLLALRTFHEEEAPNHHQGTQEEEFGSHSHGAGGHGPVQTLFEGRVSVAPTQMERLEFNKWLLNSVGSLSYLPERSLVVTVPLNDFEKITNEIEQRLISTEGMHGVEAAPPFIPEVAHLMRVDRASVFSPWDLIGSLRATDPIIQDIYDSSREVTPYISVSSDLYSLLSRMNDISQLVGLVTLLVAIPLLWLAWVVAKMLSRLLLMNERRMIGLALIRGVPIEAISQTIVIALILGGAVGGLLGLVAGFALPVLGHSLAGGPVPPLSVFVGAIAYFPIFLALGIALALLSGRSMIKQVRQLTPREAVTHVAGAELQETSNRVSRAFVIGSSIALLLGVYKIACWIAGTSLLIALLRNAVPMSLVGGIAVFEGLLNFVAVPLFLAGLVGLLRWRLTGLQYVLNIFAAPLVGKLRWFVAEHMAISRYRIASTMFLTALAMSMALLPQIAADTFYDRIMRGVQTSLGSELQLEYNMTKLAGEQDRPGTVGEYNQLIGGKLASIDAALKGHGNVQTSTEILQFVLPDVYMPTQTGLMLNLVKDPAKYRETVYSEEEVGLTRPFSEIVSALPGDTLTASSGFMQTRQVPLGVDVSVGTARDYSDVRAKFEDVVAFLPGQPSVGVSQREGYAVAEVDYLNYMMSSDARVVSTLAPFTRSALGELRVLPSKAVFLVNTGTANTPGDISRLVASLPIKPETVRTQAVERQKVSKDMFISLALENLKVFMIGGLILAVAGVFITGMANFIAERRTFALLRLRGVPLPVVLRISLAMFLLPVLLGVLMGILLGAVSGFGIAQAIWELPRVYGFAAFLDNHLTVSAGAWAILLVFVTVLSAVALGFGLWPFRRSARESLRTS